MLRPCPAQRAYCRVQPQQIKRGAAARRHPPINQLIASAPQDAMHPHASWLPGRQLPGVPGGSRYRGRWHRCGSLIRSRLC